MPRIQKVSTSLNFNAVSKTSQMRGETNDCGVKAVALLCMVSYEAAHQALKELGRVNRKGTHHSKINKAVESFGFKIKIWSHEEIKAIIQTYPGEGHRNLRQITTHHPRRFPKQWAPLKDKRLLLYVRGHVAAFSAGEVHDWSVNTSKRVWQIVEVIEN